MVTLGSSPESNESFVILVTEDPIVLTVLFSVNSTVSKSKLLTLKSTASTIGSSATRITTDSLDSGELPRVTVGSKYLVVMDFNIYVPDLSRLMDYTGSSPVCVSTYLYESGGSSILVNEHPVSRVDNWTHVTAITTLVATKGTISPEFSTASEVIQGTAKISGKITMHFISIE